MPEFSDAARALLARQDGVATRAQLVARGVTPVAVRWNSGRSWRVILPHVVGVFPGNPTERQRHIAALLWAGDDSVLAGATAARLHGIASVDPRDRCHLVVPAPRSSRASGFAVARRTLLHDRATVTKGPLRLCSPARAAVDAARVQRTEEARIAILIEAVQKGLCTLDDLTEWVHRLRPRDAASLHRPLGAAASGAWSVPEAVVLDLVATSPTLPEPWANPRLTRADGTLLTTPDVWFDEVALAVMVHSRRHHSEGELWDATVERDGDLVAEGVVVVGVTPARLRCAPADVLARVELAHAAARRRPRPAVVATPRGGGGARSPLHPGSAPVTAS